MIDTIESFMNEFWVKLSFFLEHIGMCLGYSDVEHTTANIGMGLGSRALHGALGVGVLRQNLELYPIQ